MMTVDSELEMQYRSGAHIEFEHSSVILNKVEAYRAHRYFA